MKITNNKTIIDAKEARKMIEQLCECNSFTDCGKKVDISISESQMRQDEGFIIISDDCPTGPDETDIIVQTHDGYKYYKESL